MVKKKMHGCIYIIRNKVNSKVYIGQTTKDIHARLLGHFGDSVSCRTRKICNAIRKYGKENFYIAELERCDISVINEREIFWIKQYDSVRTGYNMSRGGLGRRKFNQDDILELLKAGSTVKEVERKLGCKKDTIYTTIRLNAVGPIKNNRYQNIIQRDLEGRHINTFSSSLSAVQWCIEYGLCKSIKSRSHIIACLAGRRKNAYGYVWENGEKRC